MILKLRKHLEFHLNTVAVGLLIDIYVQKFVLLRVQLFHRGVVLEVPFEWP